MPVKDFVVAIELGSSKIRGIAGRKNIDGSITVSAIASEDSSLNIRKGIVYNIEKTVQSVSNIVNKLKGSLEREISQVYVGVGGQSILSVKNEIIRDLPQNTMITQQMVNELMDANRNKTYADKEILDVAQQEYKVDNDFQTDPAGIQADRLVGNFLNILWRKTFYNRLNDCFARAGISIAELDIAPLALADCILDDTKKRAGCLLVDLGAETTTMLVYHKNLLRHIAVIPLGSNNITKDIASLNYIDEEQAEKMKKKYGSAYVETKDMDKTLDYPIDAEHSISSIKFQQVVEARMQEIIENVWAQVPQEYKTKLNGGIVLTGGGANLRNVEVAFRMATKVDKVTTAMFILDNVNAAGKNCVVPHDGTVNTLLGLLMKGDMNCDGGDLDSHRSLFDSGVTTPTRTTTETPTTETGSSYGSAVPTGTGRVPTPGEKIIQEKQNDKKEWDKAVLDNTVEAYEKYVETFPEGDFVAEAKDKIAELKRKEGKGSKWSIFKNKLKDLVSEPEDE